MRTDVSIGQVLGLVLQHEISEGVARVRHLGDEQTPFCCVARQVPVMVRI